MTGNSVIDDFAAVQTRDTGRGADATRRNSARIPASQLRSSLAQVATAAPSAAAARQNAQLPAFAPLLEELEVAGWSSHRRMLSGNFHDWAIIEGRTLLVLAGQAVAAHGNCTIDPIEAALVAQGVWASVRSHAQHAGDAGTLLSLAAQSLWSVTNTGLQASVAVALIDLNGGHASVAVAGDCLALRIRATSSEQVATCQPALSGDTDFMYLSHSIPLAVRERIVLIADEPVHRPAKLVSKIAGSFSRLDAEAHRRMMAADAISLVRESFEQSTQDTERTTASIVAVRRR